MYRVCIVSIASHMAYTAGDKYAADLLAQLNADVHAKVKKLPASTAGLNTVRFDLGTTSVKPAAAGQPPGGSVSYTVVDFSNLSTPKASGTGSLDAQGAKTGGGSSSSDQSSGKPADSTPLEPRYYEPVIDRPWDMFIEPSRTPIVARCINPSESIRILFGKYKNELDHVMQVKGQRVGGFDHEDEENYARTVANGKAFNFFLEIETSAQDYPCAPADQREIFAANGFCLIELGVEADCDGSITKQELWDKIKDRVEFFLC